jgi:prophage regulatory protein
VGDRIVRERERRQKSGIARTTAYELEKRGLFPKRVLLVGGRVGWRESELEAWVKSRRPVAGAAA